MSKLRVGLVGCGFISNTHMEAWSRVHDAKVVSVCDIDRVKAEKLAVSYGLHKVCADYGQMFDTMDLDAVDVATPVGTHKEITVAAAEHGLHVLCQKTIAESMEDAETMVSTCEKQGVKLMIHMNFRWQPWFRDIKEMLGQGIIGEPFYTRISQRLAFTVPPKPGVEPRFNAQPYMQGLKRLITFEMALHYVDLLRHFFGNPLTVYAKVKRISDLSLGDDMVTMVLGFKGVTGVVEDSWCSKGAWLDGGKMLEGFSSRTWIEGQKGTLYFLGEEERKLRLYNWAKASTSTKDYASLAQNGSTRRMWRASPRCRNISSNASRRIGNP